MSEDEAPVDELAEQERTIEDLDDLEEFARDILGLAQDTMQRVAALESRVDEKDERIAELEAEVERLHDHEKLFGDLRRNMNSSPDERAVVLVKSLNNKALSDQELGREPRASISRDAAEVTLGGDVTRQQIHKAMDRAEELVDDKDVLRKRSGDPGRGGKDTELRLDLTAGDLPNTVAGHDIRQTAAGGPDR